MCWARGYECVELLQKQKRMRETNREVRWNSGADRAGRTYYLR